MAERNMQLPKRYPETGYYYHYKHDPSDVINNYAYFVFGAGCNTEDECPPETRFLLNYRPLYEGAFVYANGRMLDNRPLDMFFETVEHKGQTVPRFAKITDPELLAALREIRVHMYPNDFL